MLVDMLNDMIILRAYCPVYYNISEVKNYLSNMLNSNSSLLLNILRIITE